MTHTVEDRGQEVRVHRRDHGDVVLEERGEERDSLVQELVQLRERLEQDEQPGERDEADHVGRQEMARDVEVERPRAQAVEPREKSEGPHLRTAFR